MADQSKQQTQPLKWLISEIHVTSEAISIAVSLHVSLFLSLNISQQPFNSRRPSCFQLNSSLSVIYEGPDIHFRSSLRGKEKFEKPFQWYTISEHYNSIQLDEYVNMCYTLSSQ